MSKIPDIIFPYGTHRSFTEFYDWVRVTLNNGRYQMRVNSEIPDWSGEDGEFLLYTGSAGDRFYCYFNSAWNWMGFSGGTAYVTAIYDADYDTGITAEYTTDEDMLRFWTYGLQRGDVSSSGQWTMQKVDMTSGSSYDLLNLKATYSSSYPQENDGINIAFKGQTSRWKMTLSNDPDSLADGDVITGDSSGAEVTILSHSGTTYTVDIWNGTAFAIGETVKDDSSNECTVVVGLVSDFDTETFAKIEANYGDVSHDDAGGGFNFYTSYEETLYNIFSITSGKTARVNSNYHLDFRDTATYIYSASANTLNYVAATLHQFTGAITVGVNNTGYDVLFYGATTGQRWLWDQSTDTMDVQGTSQFDGTVTVGVSDTQHDVKFWGDEASSYLWWHPDTISVSETVVDSLQLVGTSALVIPQQAYIHWATNLFYMDTNVATFGTNNESQIGYSSSTDYSFIVHNHSQSYGSSVILSGTNKDNNGNAGFVLGVQMRNWHPTLSHALFAPCFGSTNPHALTDTDGDMSLGMTISGGVNQRWDKLFLNRIVFDVQPEWDGEDTYIDGETENTLIYSAPVGHNFTAGTANTDIVFNFLGTTHSGLLEWMEDEDYFKFSDDILLNTTEFLYLRDTSTNISSADANHLDIVTPTYLDLTINGTEISVASISTGTGDNDKLVTQGYVDDAVEEENLWDRTSTTLSPHTANDNVDLGSGSFTTTGTLGAGAITGTSLTDGTATLDDGALSGVTTVSMNNQLTNTLADGTAPFVITSTTVNANFNADLWDGYQFSDYLDQAVKQASSPTFVGLTLTGAIATPTTIASSGDITCGGNLIVDGGDIGLTADTDLIQIAADSVTVNGALEATGDITGANIVTAGNVDGVDISAWIDQDVSVASGPAFTDAALTTPALGTPSAGVLSSCSAYEGTAVASTGEGGGSKFLREDGDGTCSWQDAGAGAGANTALSNLVSVAINTTLLSDTDNVDALGTTAIAWSDLFLGNESVITWNSAPSTPDLTLTHSAEVLTFAGGTIALGTATATGGLTGNITGDCTGSSGSCTGESATVATITGLSPDTVTYIGTTSVALNRTSAALTLAGITLTTPDIGTPSAGVATNITGVPAASVLAGTLGTGAYVFDNTVTGITALDCDEIANVNGDLKIEPDVEGDVTLFEDTDVGDAVSGKKFIIHRKAAEGDAYIEMYIDSGNTPNIDTSQGYLVLNDEVYVAGQFEVGMEGWGDNIAMKHFGNITAGGGDKYIQWQVNDATDYFELTREDANVLGFDIQMPLVTDAVTIGGTWTAASQTCTDLGSVTTADINGGTFDGIVGGTTPAAGTFNKVIANANLDVKNGAASSGVLAIYEDSTDGTNKATFQVPALAADTVYTLPPDDGADTNVLQTDGSGVLTWVAAGAGGGDSWGDVVDADIIPDGDSTRDIGATNTVFAEGWFDAIKADGDIILSPDGYVKVDGNLNVNYASDPLSEGHFYGASHCGVIIENDAADGRGGMEMESSLPIMNIGINTNRAIIEKGSNKDGGWLRIDARTAERRFGFFWEYAGSNSETEVAYIDSAGNCKLNGLQDSVSGYKVNSDADAHIDDSTRGTGTTVLYIGTETIDTSPVSDQRFKKDVVNTRYGLSDLNKIKVRDFKFTDEYKSDSPLYTGCIAQELEKVYPFAVKEITYKELRGKKVTKKEATDESEDIKHGYMKDKEKYYKIDYDKIKVVDYKKLVPLLIEAVQDLSAEVKALKAKN